MEEKHNNHNLLNSLLSVVDPFQVFRHHETDANKRSGKPRRLKFTSRPSSSSCASSVSSAFWPIR